MAENKGFFAGINDSEAGQILALASNSIGVGSFLFAIASGLLTESDTDKIINAIAQLQQTLDSDFAALGNLIKQQIQLVIQNEDTLALAAALAHTSTASDKVQRFLRTQDAADLDDADTESDLGIQFFLGLPAAQPGAATVANRTDPFFLPGIAKAGTIRILVIIRQDPNFRMIESDVNQIRNIINLLQGMVDSIKNTVNNAHTVELKSHVLHTSRGSSEPVINFDGYFHAERGKQLEFFGASTTNEDDPRLAKALALAQKARDNGVAAELAFLGIPGFERLLDQWKKTLTSQLTTSVGAGNTVGILKQ